MKKHDMQQGLKQAFAFQSKDLSANREGHLSTAQCEQLAVKTKNFWRNIVITAVIMSIFTLIILFVTGLLGVSGHTVVILFMIAVTILIVGIMRFDYIMYQRDLKENQPAIEHGQIELIASKSGKTGQLKVNDKTFTISARQYDIMQQLHDANPALKIIVYYGKHSERIFAIDLMDG